MEPLLTMYAEDADSGENGRVSYFSKLISKTLVLFCVNLFFNPSLFLLFFFFWTIMSCISYHYALENGFS